jgi:hypothetical protein
MKTLAGYVALLFLIALPSTVPGCSCSRSEPGEAFNRASAVFIGKVGDSTEKQRIITTSGGTVVLEWGRVMFDVREVFKGDIGETVTADITGGCRVQGMQGGATLCL